jgi:molybdopterin synthase catalytic subunit
LRNFGSQLRCYIEHYKGKLELGGISVIIAVGSPHRDESFKACRYLIEELKVRVPVWKQEHYVDGDAGWLDGHQLSK